VFSGAGVNYGPCWKPAVRSNSTSVAAWPDTTCGIHGTMYAEIGLTATMLDTRKKYNIPRRRDWQLRRRMKN
jgi:hypothetical protein